MMFNPDLRYKIIIIQFLMLKQVFVKKLKKKF